MQAKHLTLSHIETIVPTWNDETNMKTFGILFARRKKKLDKSENNKLEQAKSLANEWDHRQIEIKGFDGYGIQVHRDTGDVTTRRHWNVRTTNHLYDCVFVVEQSRDVPGAVAFRVRSSSSKYLTVQVYGDRLRQQTATILASFPTIPADTIPLIVDYAIGRPTGESNFEGSGFHYSPMVALKGCPQVPNKMQLFTLETISPSKFGVRSLFGTYWRSQHWNRVVSQSPHLLGDETWTFYQNTLEETYATTK